MAVKITTPGKILIGILFLIFVIIGLFYGSYYYGYLRFKNEGLVLTKGIGWNQGSQVDFYEYSFWPSCSIGCGGNYKAVLVLLTTNKTESEIDSIIREYPYMPVFEPRHRSNTKIFPPSFDRSGMTQNKQIQLQELYSKDGYVHYYLAKPIEPKWGMAGVINIDYIKIPAAEKWRYGDKEFSGNLLVVQMTY